MIKLFLSLIIALLFHVQCPSEVNITISNIVEEIIRLHSSNLQLPVSLIFPFFFSIWHLELTLKVKQLRQLLSSPWKQACMAFSAFTWKTLSSLPRAQHCFVYDNRFTLYMMYHHLWSNVWENIKCDFILSAKVIAIFT